MIKEALDILEEKNPALFCYLSFKDNRPKSQLSSLEDARVCYAYGARLSTYQLFLPWLGEKKERELILIDDHIGYWQDLFEKEESVELLKDPRVTCFALDDYNRLAWQSALKKWTFVSLKEGGDEIRTKIENAKRGVELVFVDFQNFGLDHFKSVVQNLTNLKQVTSILQLKNKLQGSPALICGGGASLDVHCDLIRKWKDCAYIFAGGRGVEKLFNLGLDADFIGAIDPVALYPQFEEMSKKAKLLFYQDRVCPQLLKQSHATAVFCGAPKGYPLIHWLYRTLGIDLTFDPGWDVSNFLFAVARYLGCSPIILAGQDHCYRSLEEAGFQNMPLKVVKDEEGNLCYSKDDFILASEWFEGDFYKIGKGLAIEGAKPLNIEPVPISKINDFQLSSTAIDLSLEQLKSSLKEEICYTYYLEPLWDIFKYVMGPEYQTLFYKDALSKLYEAIIPL